MLSSSTNRNTQSSDNMQNSIYAFRLMHVSERINHVSVDINFVRPYSYSFPMEGKDGR